MTSDSEAGKNLSSWKPGRQRRRGVYFRVEVYDQTSVCWLDAPGTFESVEKASAFVARELKGRCARIMKIDGRARSVIQ